MRDPVDRVVRALETLGVVRRGYRGNVAVGIGVNSGPVAGDEVLITDATRRLLRDGEQLELAAGAVSD
jgi:hypothetical protein